MSGPNDAFSHITPQILLKAYSVGLFPMSESADDPTIFWVEPEMRGVMPIDTFHIPRSLAKFIKKDLYQITFNKAFSSVISSCAASTKDREETWINDTIRQLYGELHAIGHAHSVEAWYEGQLVGGLYGVSLGRAFFGESMFSRQSNASKVCLVNLVERLKRREFILLDTQFNTEHLTQFGTREVPRDDYENLLEEALISNAKFD